MYWPSYYVVWVTALTEKYSGPLVEELIKKGYTVATASGDGRIALSTPDSVSSIIALTLSKNGKLRSNLVHGEVKEALYNIGAYYYSIVVMSALGDVAWTSGNIVIQYGPAGKPKQKPSHLKLVKNEPTIPNE